VVAAALVLAWLAFSVHLLDLQEEGDSTLKRAERGHVSAADVQRAADALRKARRDNADVSPMLDEGFLMSATGRRQDAFGLALRAVEKEPDNVQGWTLLYLSAPTKQSVAGAKRGIDRLNPWLADTLR
jgi:hypothetical protein